MLIGVDIDEVLLNLLPALNEFHNRVYGTNLRKEDYHTYQLGETWGCSIEEAESRVRIFCDAGGLLELEPVEGAMEALTELREDHGLLSITSRSTDHAKDTVESMDMAFPGIFTDRVYFAMNPYLGSDSTKTKGDYCMEFGIDYMIDDSVHQAEMCRDAGAEVLLFDTVQNQRENPEGVTRVSGWREAMEQFK